MTVVAAAHGDDDMELRKKLGHFKEACKSWKSKEKGFFLTLCAARREASDSDDDERPSFVNAYKARPHLWVAHL